MNLSTAIFLVNKSVRPVRVSYDPDISSRNNPDYYFKTLDPSLAVGDMVVVPTNTRHKMTVCKVEEIDFTVNFDTHTEYRWVIGKVDTPAYEAIVAQEAIVTSRIGKAEENRKRAELAAALGLGDIDLTDLDVVRATASAPKLATPRGEEAPEAPTEV